jgi:hypothetical protein
MSSITYIHCVCFLQIQVHGSDLTSFYAEVPKEILPNEYGGKSRSIAENWGMTFDSFFLKIKAFQGGSYTQFLLKEMQFEEKNHKT